MQAAVFAHSPLLASSVPRASNPSPSLLASAAARATAAMLLVVVEPQSGGPADDVGNHLDRAEVQERFASSGTPWVFCRPDPATAAALLADPGLNDMRDGGGVFVVDHAHDAWQGRIVSILPRTPGT